MRRTNATTKRPATSPTHPHERVRRGGIAAGSSGRVVASAADIRGVEAGGPHAGEADGRDLDAGVVGGVGPGVLEDREAGGDDDGDALGLQGDVAVVAVALRAGADLAVAEVRDPARVGDDLVVRAC